MSVVRIPRKLPYLMLLALIVGACERHESEPLAETTAIRHPDPSSARDEPPPAPSAVPAAQRRCLVPLAETPPPHATPSATCPADPTGPMTLPRGWVSFPEAPGAPRLNVEIATTDASRERGLMYVKKMPDDQGMIFSWTDQDERSFWMHDTCIPLDMLYIASDGTIVGVLEEVPAMDETPREIPCPASHVLEVNAGWTRAHGVAPGQRIRIET